MTRLNARAWAVWVLAACLPALIARNPVVLLPALLAVAVVRSRLEDDAATRSLPVWRLGLTLVVVATAWNALTAH